MILPDHEIARLGRSGGIDPFREDQVQPSSYDVRLDQFAQAARDDWHEVIDLGESAPDWMTEVDLGRSEDACGDYVPEFRRGFVLRPQAFILGSTVEKVAIPADLCGRVDGKSSLARYGLQIHSAGFLDPGYRGNVTLEIINFGPRPIRLRADRLIAQIEFVRLTSPAMHPYSGRYQGSSGAVASRYNNEVRVDPRLFQDMEFPDAYLTDPDARRHNPT